MEKWWHISFNKKRKGILYLHTFTLWPAYSFPFCCGGALWTIGSHHCLFRPTNSRQTLLATPRRSASRSSFQSYSFSFRSDTFRCFPVSYIQKINQVGKKLKRMGKFTLNAGLGELSGPSSHRSNHAEVEASTTSWTCLPNTPWWQHKHHPR